MGNKLQMIPLGTIRESEIALRTVDHDSEGFQGLVLSVKANGVINAISVRPDPNGSGFILIDGLHRYSAAKVAGLTEIPAQVLDTDESSVLELQIEGNLHKVETRPVQYTKQLQRIMARHPDRTVAEQAARLHKSSAWLNERLQLTNLTTEAQVLVDEGSIVISNAYTLARLPEEEQGEWLERAQTLPPNEFIPAALQRSKELKQLNKGMTPTTVGPSQRMRKLGDIKSELDRSIDLPSNVPAEQKPYAEGYRDALKWVLQVDEASLAAWEAEQAKLAAEKEAKRLARVAERDNKSMAAALGA